MKTDLDFDEEAYCAIYLDVGKAVASGHFTSGWDHFVRHGRDEGRDPTGKSKQNRNRARRALGALDKSSLILEIGPSHNPIAPKREGYNVHVLDHASQEDLRDKYREHGVDLAAIEHVDFVWQGGALAETVGGEGIYDGIIASHVIEHVPDFVTFLQQCAAILKDGATLSLVIPDKRFCFDYFSRVTTTGDVLDAHVERRVRPSPGQVFHHLAHATARGASIAWDGNAVVQPHELRLLHTLDDARNGFERARLTTEYIDVHCWRFTPESFQLLITDLTALQLIGFRVESISQRVGCEFFCSLVKDSEPHVHIASQRRLSQLEEIYSQ